jgi:hypothetical protein
LKTILKESGGVMPRKICIRPEGTDLKKGTVIQKPKWRNCLSS